VLGTSNAGKTRLAYEAIHQTLPEWSVLVWSPTYRSAADLPPINDFRGRDVILFVDNVPNYAPAAPAIQTATTSTSEGAGTTVSTTATLASPEADTLLTLYQRAEQHASRLAIVATCRIDGMSEHRAEGALRWLFNLLTPIRVTTFSESPEDPRSKEIIAEFVEAGSMHVEDWNGKIGSLVLGFSDKRQQFDMLLSEGSPAVTVLCAMKLLDHSGITDHTARRLRAICADILRKPVLRDAEEVWLAACRELDRLEFVRLERNESDDADDTEVRALVIRKDGYFDQVIACYGRDDDLPRSDDSDLKRDRTKQSACCLLLKTRPPFLIWQTGTSTFPTSPVR
jgi:hypothetical protein